LERLWASLFAVCLQSRSGCSANEMGASSGSCGDGIVQSEEACDSGMGNSDTQPDSCRSDCRAAHCGDGVKDAAEECDDGNSDGSDLCSNACTTECNTHGQCQATGACSAALVCRDFPSIVKIASGCGYPNIVTSSSIAAVDAFLPELAEGINAFAQNEFMCLSSANTGHDVVVGKSAFLPAPPRLRIHQVEVADCTTGCAASLGFEQNGTHPDPHDAAQQNPTAQSLPIDRVVAAPARPVE